MRIPRLRRLALTTTGAVAVALASAGGASAATVFVSPEGVLTYDAAPGERNAIRLVQLDDLPEDVTDVEESSQVPLTVGAGCVPFRFGGGARCSGVTSALVRPGDQYDEVDALFFEVSATVPDSGGGMTFVGGEGDDVATVVGNVPSDLSGNSGDDLLRTFEGAQVLDGGLGNDTLEPGSGDDTVLGGPGNDFFLDGGQPGSDSYDGDLGFDRVSYLQATPGVTVTIGEGATRNDGNATIGFDDVQGTVEAVTGSFQDDVLTGSDGPNTLAGYDGNDTMSGGMGNDFMGGGAPGQTSPVDERDVFEGGDQADTVTYSFLGTVPGGVTVTLDGLPNDGILGEADNVGTDVERINGSNNGDSLTGNPTMGTTLVGFGGTDTLTGGIAADFLDGGQDGAATGSNVLSCGGGTDTYRINSVPAKPADCENGV